jgi:multidrug efflux pump subunit AcrA (membrane-fusion protein)
MSVKLESVRRSVRRRLCAVAFVLTACAPALAGAQGTNQVRAVPVTVTKAVQRDVPIWLHGLGTVQANFSVQIRSRVDGTLTDVPAKEGQDVKKGDLLAVIDPRPYQAALDAVTHSGPIWPAMRPWRVRPLPRASSWRPSRRW